MQLDLGDVPAWVALAVSVGAIIVAVQSSRHAKDSADASKDSAVSARRSADAAERQAQAAEAALPPPAPEVAWRVEHVNRQRYLLRNIGVGTATGLRIDVRDAHPLVGLENEGKPIGPNSSISFLISSSLAVRAPTELWLTWDGQDEPVAVPIP